MGDLEVIISYEFRPAGLAGVQYSLYHEVLKGFMVWVDAEFSLHASELSPLFLQGADDSKYLFIMDFIVAFCSAHCL